MKNLIVLASSLIGLAFVQASSAAVLITQYYEGTSNNKWVELTNLGLGSVDLSGFSLTIWQNANAEGWKSGGTASATMALSGSLPSGSSVLYAHASAALPTYAVPTATNSTVINFNGNDSMVLYEGAVLADAIGFTNTGNEGANTSFVRTSTAPGYDLVIGSNATSFPGIWQAFTNADVDIAVAGTNERLGVSTLPPVPEPSIAGLLGISAVALLLRRRSRR